MLFRESIIGLGGAVRSWYELLCSSPLVLRQLFLSLSDVSAGFHTRADVYWRQDLPCSLPHQTLILFLSCVYWGNRGLGKLSISSPCSSSLTTVTAFESFAQFRLNFQRSRDLRDTKHPEAYKTRHP